MKIYISGPISGREKTEYLAHFEQASAEARLKGWDVLNPAQANLMIANVFSYEDVMKVCMTEVEACDAILLLDGWEKSKGAVKELTKALTLKMHVFYEGCLPAAAVLRLQRQQ